MKYSKHNILFFIIAVAATACRGAMYNTFTPSPAFPSRPLIETIVPSPTIKVSVAFNELKTITISDGKPPDFVNSTGSLPVAPGIYMVYSNLYSVIRYISVDGSSEGDLYAFSNKFREPIMLTSKEMPGFVFDEKRGSVIIKEDTVWFSDMLGNSLKTWDVNADTNVVCREPAISPNGRWMVVDCSHHFDHYLNLVDTQAAKENKTYQVGCDEGEPVRVPKIIWSSDESNFLYNCTPYKQIYCFVSTSDNNVNCKQMRTNKMGVDREGLDIWSVSPDWSKIVLDMGYLQKNKDGLIPGFRILVTDLDCVLNKLVCDRGTTFDLPFSLPYLEGDIKNNVGTNLQLYWNKSMDALVWVATSSSYSGSFYRWNHLSGWIDLATNTNHVFDQQLDESTIFWGISPDDKWILFQDSSNLYSNLGGLYVMSLEDGNIRRLVQGNKMTNYIHFYGWLVVP